jgi:hypothetical protein
MPSVAGFKPLYPPADKHHFAPPASMWRFTAHDRSVMPYALHRLAAGSFDLLLDGTVMGSVVRDITADGEVRRWRAELLDDLPPTQRPQPFIEIEHRFDTLEEVLAWLGDAEIASNS